MTKNIFPAGAIIFLHEGAPAEHVPYMTEDEMVEALQGAIDQNLNPDMVWPYVDPKRLGLVKRLYEAMETGYGEAYSVYALTPENARVVLADYTFVIQPQYA